MGLLSSTRMTLGESSLQTAAKRSVLTSTSSTLDRRTRFYYNNNISKWVCEVEYSSGGNTFSFVDSVYNGSVTPAGIKCNGGSGTSDAPYTFELAFPPVLISPSTAQTITVGNSVTFTATNTLTDPKVKWSVSGTAVTLYSTAVDAGTVTLLSKECVAASKFNDSSDDGNTYSGSTLETAVNTYYTNNFSTAAQAAVSSSGLFILTKDQANSITVDVRKCSQYSGISENVWRPPRFAA